MLVLERKPGQSITIVGPNGLTVAIELTEVLKGKAKIGVTADKSVRILRSEFITTTTKES